MLATELLQSQIEDSGFQVRQVLAGLSGEQWDAKVNENAMSPRETVIHLTECYLATGAATRGEQHAWGSYQPTDTSEAAILAAWESERAAASALVTANPEHVGTGSAYIVGHDYYHVGQLVTLRLTLGGFDPYSIYRHG